MKIKIFLTIILFILSSCFVIAGGGGATVPVDSIELTEQGTDYNIKPARLKFEFDGDFYAIQVRRVKQDHVDFIILNLDEANLNDITAYILEESFSLSPNERKEIDLDGDKVNDMLIELSNIISTAGSIKSADFSIKRINVKQIELPVDEDEPVEEENLPDEPTSEIPVDDEKTEIENTTEIGIFSEVIEVKIQKPDFRLIINSNQVNLEQSTFLDRIISFLKEMF